MVCNYRFVSLPGAWFEELLSPQEAAVGAGISSSWYSVTRCQPRPQLGHQ